MPSSKAVLPQRVQDELEIAWQRDKRVPTLASRRAWAQARDANPEAVNRWFSRRRWKAIRQEKVDVDDSEYDLPVGRSCKRKRAPAPEPPPLTSVRVKRERAASPDLSSLPTRPAKKVKAEPMDPSLAALRSTRHTRAHDKQPHSDCAVCFPPNAKSTRARRPTKTPGSTEAIRHTRAHDSAPVQGCPGCFPQRKPAYTQPAQPVAVSARRTARSPDYMRLSTPPLEHGLPSSDFEELLTPAPSDDGGSSLVDKGEINPNACTFSSSLALMRQSSSDRVSSLALATTKDQPGNAYTHVSASLAPAGTRSTSRLRSVRFLDVRETLPASPGSSNASVTPSTSTLPAYTRSDFSQKSAPTSHSVIPPRFKRKLDRAGPNCLPAPLPAAPVSTQDEPRDVFLSTRESSAKPLASADLAVSSGSVLTGPGCPGTFDLSPSMFVKSSPISSVTRSTTGNDIRDCVPSGARSIYSTPRDPAPKALNEQPQREIKPVLTGGAVRKSLMDDILSRVPVDDIPRTERSKIVSAWLDSEDRASPQSAPPHSTPPSSHYYACTSNDCPHDTRLYEPYTQTDQAAAASNPRPPPRSSIPPHSSAPPHVFAPPTVSPPCTVAPQASYVPRVPATTRARPFVLRPTAFTAPAWHTRRTGTTWRPQPIASQYPTSPAVASAPAPSRQGAQQILPVDAAVAQPPAAAPVARPHELTPPHRPRDVGALLAAAPAPVFGPQSVQKTSPADVTAAPAAATVTRPHELPPPHRPHGGPPSRPSSPEPRRPVRPGSDGGEASSASGKNIAESVQEATVFKDLLLPPALSDPAPPPLAPTHASTNTSRADVSAITQPAERTAAVGTSVKLEEEEDAVIMLPPPPALAPSKSLRVSYSSDGEPLLLAVRRKNKSPPAPSPELSKDKVTSSHPTARKTNASQPTDPSRKTAGRSNKGNVPANKNAAAATSKRPAKAGPAGDDASEEPKREEPKPKPKRVRKPRKKAAPPLFAPDAEWQALFSGQPSLFPGPIPSLLGDAHTTSAPGSRGRKASRASTPGPMLMHPPRPFAYDPASLIAYQGCAWDADGFGAMELSALPWLASTGGDGAVKAQDADLGVSVPSSDDTVLDFGLPADDPAWGAYLKFLPHEPAGLWMPLEESADAAVGGGCREDGTEQ
ncbi:hypothetical protein PsYK624_067700 [Phanerochaete sordida]|uniref:Homeobox domain-containing protein n=1 Tax=Phanerochaete sordida TaxID=48140 RepID=A0A9P3LCM1_9APHY|nr:hypothetical protein PsYK624_067700 [Phanerochaete sordida]